MALAYALSKHKMQHGVGVTYLMQGIDSFLKNTFLSLLLKHLLMFAREEIRTISLIAEPHVLRQRKEVNNPPESSKGHKVNSNTCLRVVLEIRLAEGDRWEVGGGTFSDSYDIPDH